MPAFWRDAQQDTISIDKVMQDRGPDMYDQQTREQHGERLMDDRKEGPHKIKMGHIRVRKPQAWDVDHAEKA